MVVRLSFELFLLVHHNVPTLLKQEGVTGFLGSLKISLCEERRLKDAQNLKCEDRRLQKLPSLKIEELAAKPIKPEDRRFVFLTGKI